MPPPSSTSTPPTITPSLPIDLHPGKPTTTPGTTAGFTWTGDVPPQKWMNFYTKVLSKFASGRGLKLTVKIEVSPEGGVSKQKAEETKTALRELGLNGDVKTG